MGMTTSIRGESMQWATHLRLIRRGDHARWEGHAYTDLATGRAYLAGGGRCAHASYEHPEFKNVPLWERPSRNAQRQPIGTL